MQQEQSRNSYKNCSEEERDKKREYRRNSYQTMFGEDKPKVKQPQKAIVT